MKKKQTYIELISVLLLAVFIYLLILFCKGIVPFGRLSIAFTGDYLSQYLPFYYGVWDILHGSISSEFSWNLSLGMGLAGGLSHFYVRNPWLILLLFFSREAVPYGMTFVYGCVLATMAVGMDFLLQKEVLLSPKRGYRFVRISCSLLYAYSLHSIMYMGMGWPITGMVLPFLLYFLNCILDGQTSRGAYIGYVAALTLLFCLNIPQAYAVCLFLILYVGFIACYKGNRELSIRNFIWCSLIALGISMVLFLPALLNTMESYRYTLFEEGSVVQNYHHKIAAEGLEAFRKHQMLLWIGPVFVILLVLAFGVIKKKPETKRRCWGIIGFNIVVLLPLIVEVVNIMWNNGPYVCFPVRHGYLLYFTVIASLYLLLEELDIKRVAYGLIGLISICSIWYAGCYVQKYISTVAPETVLVDRDEQNDYLLRTRMTDRDSADGIDALKYAASMVGNYYPLNTAEQIETNQILGYNQDYVRISDAGGTALSDLLLGIQGEYPTSPVFFVSENNWIFANQLSGQGQFTEQNRISRMLFGMDLIEVYQAEDVGNEQKAAWKDNRYVLYLSQPEEHKEIQQLTAEQLDEIGDDVLIGALDSEKLQECIRKLLIPEQWNVGATDMEVRFTALEKGYLLISAYAGSGWNYQINGNPAVATENPYHLMMIPVEKGSNEFVAQWKQPGKTMGIVISLIALLVLLSLIMTKAFEKQIVIPLKPYSLLMKAALVLVGLYIYIIPMLYRGLRFIKNIVL